MTLALDPEFLRTFPPEEEYLVGVSGGRDSVALVLALREAGYERLILCHVNHGLRGEAAQGDEDFVGELGARWDLPVRVEHVAEGFYDEGGSVEERAREARLVFFKQVAEQELTQGGGARRVLLGHHAEDQAETILFNLCRGSAGLRGMKLTQEMGEVTLVRPLLGARRAEITAFLTERGQAFREDASNASGEFTRNRFRHEVLPLLAEIMGRDVVPQMTRAFRISAQETEAMDQFLKEANLYDPQGRIFLPTLEALPVAFQRRALSLYLRSQGVSQLDEALLARCLLLVNEEDVAKVNLPKGRYLRRKEKRLFVS